MAELPEQLLGNRQKVIFGGGINTALSEFEIDERECAEGSKNFDILLDDNMHRPRKPFDLIATAPNAEPIYGAAQLRKQDGSLSTLIQAGTTVYTWDGESTFTEIAQVASGARLRGHPDTHNFTLDEIVVITDLALKEVVKYWDGTTFDTIAHDLGAGVDFKAKYAHHHGGRMFYANVVTSSTTPHLIAASKVEDYDALSISVKAPASGGTAENAFYLLTPDLKPINGISSAFNLLAVSSIGEMFKITGNDQTNFDIASFYPNSGANGLEPLVFAGNDFAYGGQGKIETLFATETLGDVSTDNLTRPIADIVKEDEDWVMVFNERLQRVYCNAKDTERLLVFNKPFLDERVRQLVQRREIPDLSPWSIWTTDHAFAFRPAMMMSLYRQADGLKQVFMGGTAGQIYQLEGSGGQDGGTTDIESIRISKMLRAPDEATGFDISGYVYYRSVASVTLTLTLKFHGESLYDQEFTITLDGPSGGSFFGGDVYFSGDFYFNAKFRERFRKNEFGPSGGNSAFQLELKVSDAKEFAIGEVGIQFKSV